MGSYGFFLPLAAVLTKSAWAALRNVGEKKSWYSVVGFHRSVPKWALASLFQEIGY